jgi:hypothetical protein
MLPYKTRGTHKKKYFKIIINQLYDRRERERDDVFQIVHSALIQIVYCMNIGKRLIR